MSDHQATTQSSPSDRADTGLPPRFAFHVAEKLHLVSSRPSLLERCCVFVGIVAAIILCFAGAALGLSGVSDQWQALANELERYPGLMSALVAAVIGCLVAAAIDRLWRRGD